MHPTNFNVDVARFCVSLHEVNPDRIVNFDITMAIAGI